MAYVLDDLQLSRNDVSLGQGIDLYQRLHNGDHSKRDRWGVEWCKLMLASCDRLSVVCSDTGDSVARLLQSCSDRLKTASEEKGTVFKPDPKVLESFGEETARCLSERLLAQCLKVIQPQLRRGAGQGPWEVVSPGGASLVGTVEVMKALPLQLAPGKAPCIAVTETLTGWEDIPAGIVAVLLPAAHAVDVLSHVAIRARNQKVLLASCDDDKTLDCLRAAAGTKLMLSVGASGDVTWRTPTTKEITEATQNVAAATGKKLTVAKP